MIGDKLIDLECGWNAGVKKCLLVRTGYGAELERTARRQAWRRSGGGRSARGRRWILSQPQTLHWAAVNHR